jgi:DNA-binding SARP family transcriptional activator
MIPVTWQQGWNEHRIVTMGRQRTTPQQDAAVARTGAASLQIQLLGGFRVAVGARVVADDDWRLLKARALVKLLALDPRHRLTREQVLDALWPDADPDAARRSFNYALHVARRALDRDEHGTEIRPSLLRFDQGLLSFQVPGGLLIDIDDFTAAAAIARERATIPAYQDALARYSGELLPDDRYED